MEIDQFYIPENKISDSDETHSSPFGQYILKTEVYRTTEGVGSVSRGLIYKKEDQNVHIFEVRRNYNQFPFCFVEGHPTGHDYLICGEDYQGQTVLELDTGNRVSHMPEGEKNGVGFCWSRIWASTEKDVLGVEGCFWAAPNELRFIDFSEPMKLPFLVLSSFPYIEDNSELSKPWSAITGVEIIDSNEDGTEKKKIQWRKPSYADVAQYWQKEVKDVRPDSYFYPDIKAQEQLALARAAK